MGEWGGWGTFVLFAIAMGTQFALFAVFAGPLMRAWYAVPAVAALWVGIERAHGHIGFFWLKLGNAGTEMGIPMRLAPLVGVYGLSFVFAMMSVAVALLLLRRPRREIAWLLALPLLYLLPDLPAPAKGSETAVAIQPNVPQDAPRWNAESSAALIQRVSMMSLKAALDFSPSLLLWPESPAPFYYGADPVFQDSVKRLARATRAWFLFGAVSWAGHNRPKNSAILLGPSGEFVARYDKMNLVPFGEFVPPLFSFVNRITQEAGDFEPGEDQVIMRVGPRRLATFICYESAFPHFVREFTDNGAGLLVNMTNDGYFGRTSARQQHLLHARMRAAENGRWVLRPTNDGYTMAIDPAGRIREQFPPFEVTAAPLHFSWLSGKPPYVRYGDWFAWLCLAASLGLSLFLMIMTRRGS
jgi:apolipoprotein N-acyltransferase